MIKNSDRTPFLEVSRPPRGYSLDYCIGTTYTLDVMCLIQMAFNTRGIETDEAERSNLEVFEALEEFTRKSYIFAQSCQIKSLPVEKFEGAQNERGRVYKLIDRMVHTVNAPSLESAFHPKIWVFRFDSDEKGVDPIFRIVVCSRNLTRAYDLDVMVCLEGQPNLKAPGEVFGISRIAEFLAEIAANSTGRRDRGFTNLLVRLKADLEDVRFRPLPGFQSVTFLPKTPNTRYWFLRPDEYDRLFVISPFLRAGFLKDLNKLSTYTIVTSSADISELGVLEPGEKREIYQFRNGGLEVGLHAKMYVAKLKNGGSVAYLGSANATTAAHYGNSFEAMVELHSSRNLVQALEADFLRNEKGKTLNLFKKLDVESIRATESTDEQAPERKLNRVQNWIALGNFKIEFKKGQRKATVSYENKSKSISIPGLRGYVQIHGAKAIPLNVLLSKGSVQVAIDRKVFSRIVSINLDLNAQTKLFATVALTNLPHHTRLNTVRAELINNTEKFFEYLSTLIEMAPGASRYQANKRNKKKSRKNSERSVRDITSSLIETLLLGSVSDDRCAGIDKALRMLKAKGKDQIRIRQFETIWSEYKRALQEIKRRVC